MAGAPVLADAECQPLIPAAGKIPSPQTGVDTVRICREYEETAAVRARHREHGPARGRDDGFRSPSVHRHSKDLGLLGVAVLKAVIEIDVPAVRRPSRPVDMPRALVLDDLALVLAIRVGNQQIVASEPPGLM